MICARDLEVKYWEKKVLNQVDFKVNKGEIVTIIGPNGSGKTTLIKALSRNIALSSGEIYLENKKISAISSKEIAKKMAVLPQSKHISADISVESLVSYGRYPHLGFMSRLGLKDKEKIDWALEKTGMLKLRKRQISQLSGGERQRAWIAMALAQEPELLLLDEPTTYLDISYQLEVLELIKELNESLGITVVMVLHDINQAARYSHRIYVLKKGRVFHQGPSREIIDRDLLKEVFKISAHIYEDKINSCYYFIASEKAD